MIAPVFTLVNSPNRNVIAKETAMLLISHIPLVLIRPDPMDTTFVDPERCSRESFCLVKNTHMRPHQPAKEKVAVI